MLGELYANALGIKRDYAQGGRMVPARRRRRRPRGHVRARDDAAVRPRRPDQPRARPSSCWRPSAKLGNPKAAYNLALLYLDGQTLPQDVKRAAELLRIAADAGNPEAQYALATFYKEGTGVPKDLDKAVRLLQAASLADNVDAEVEYAIALFNGTGTPKNEPPAMALLRKAARQNSPIAQNRLARVLVTGQGRAGGQDRGPEMAHCRQDRRQGRPGAGRGAGATSARRSAPRRRRPRANGSEPAPNDALTAARQQGTHSLPLTASLGGIPLNLA